MQISPSLAAARPYPPFPSPPPIGLCGVIPYRRPSAYRMPYLSIFLSFEFICSCYDCTVYTVQIRPALIECLTWPGNVQPLYTCTCQSKSPLTADFAAVSLDILIQKSFIHTGAKCPDLHAFRYIILLSTQNQGEPGRATLNMFHYGRCCGFFKL